MEEEYVPVTALRYDSEVGDLYDWTPLEQERLERDYKSGASAIRVYADKAVGGGGLLVILRGLGYTTVRVLRLADPFTFGDNPGEVRVRDDGSMYVAPLSYSSSSTGEQS